MAHMQAEVTDKKWWISVDGPQGVEWIPEDLVGAGVVPECKADHRGQVVVPDAIKDFCENRTAFAIERVRGYGVRLSAPGYLDATDWSVYTNKREALRAARELEAED